MNGKCSRRVTGSSEDFINMYVRHMDSFTSFSYFGAVIIVERIPDFYKR